MKKSFKVCKIVVIILFVLLLTACWDSKDIEKKNILTALIIDNKNNEYSYYIEVANPSGKTTPKDESHISQDFSILMSNGSTFSKARDNYNRKSVKELFLGAGRILIFTDRMSKEGIEEYINRLRGQVDYRKSILIATTDEEPEKFLKIETENAASLGFAIESNLNTLVEDGTSFTVNIGDILQIVSVGKPGFLMPNLSMADRKVLFTGYSVFNNNKKIGQLSAQDRNGVVFLLNNKSKFYYDIFQANRKYTARVILKDKNIETNYINDQLVFNLHMKFNVIISLVDKMAPISSEDYNSISKKVEELTKKQIEQAIYISQNKYNCDYLNFYKYFRIYYPKEFEKADWNKLYSNAVINVSTNANIVESNIPQKQ